MATPISPAEAKSANAQMNTPVISVVNEILTQKAGQNSIRIMQKELSDRLSALGYNIHELIANGSYDFEEAYRTQGWTVSYDKPGWNESYDAYWVFSSK